jgi:hypothetical protein
MHAGAAGIGVADDDRDVGFPETTSQAESVRVGAYDDDGRLLGRVVIDFDDQSFFKG